MVEGISFIICCYNSATRIEKTLYHIARQKVAAGVSLEVILVDNASHDNTAEVARSAWSGLSGPAFPLRIVNQPIRGQAFARQKGVEESIYDIVIFCDDDNWLNSDYADRTVHLFRNEAIAAAGGTGKAVSDIALPLWFDKHKHVYACSAQGDATGELPSPRSLYGAGKVVRREALMKLSKLKFDPILTGRVSSRLSSGDDVELCLALRVIGYKLWYSEDLHFQHFIPASRLTLRYIERLNKGLSYSAAGLIAYHYVLMNKKVGRITWIKDVCIRSLNYFRAILQVCFFGRPWLERKMAIDFSYNSLLGVIVQFGKYRSRCEKIARMRLGDELR